MTSQGQKTNLVAGQDYTSGLWWFKSSMNLDLQLKNKLEGAWPINWGNSRASVLSEEGWRGLGCSSLEQISELILEWFHSSNPSLIQPLRSVLDRGGLISKDNALSPLTPAGLGVPLSGGGNDAVGQAGVYQGTPANSRLDMSCMVGLC